MATELKLILQLLYIADNIARCLRHSREEHVEFDLLEKGDHLMEDGDAAPEEALEDPADEWLVAVCDHLHLSILLLFLLEQSLWLDRL